MWLSFVAIGAGAALGAWLRFGLNLWLGPMSGPVPLGTLAANLLGGYAIGISLAWLAARPDLAPEWRLFIITGLLGGLTTFSTFSAEMVELLHRQHFSGALSTAALNLFGSLAMTALGGWTWHFLRGS